MFSIRKKQNLKQIPHTYITGHNEWESLPTQGYTTLNSQLDKAGVMSTSLFIHDVEQTDVTGQKILNQMLLM